MPVERGKKMNTLAVRTHREVAEILGIPVGSVSVYEARAFKKMAEALGDFEDWNAEKLSARKRMRKQEF